MVHGKNNVLQQAFRLTINDFYMKKGFTLMEILIATGIVAGLSIVIVQLFLSTVRSNAKTEIIKETKQNGDFALSVMERMIRNATSVTSTCDGTAQNSITFVNPDETETTLQCKDSSGIARIESLGPPSTYLTGSNVTLGATCDDLSPKIFTCDASSLGLPSAVTISFQLQQISTSGDNFETSTATFKTRINLRNISE